MSTTKIYFGGPLVASGSGAFSLYGIEQQSIDPKQSVVQLHSAGGVYPTHTAIYQIQPVMPLSVHDLKVAFDAGIWMDGFAIPQSTTYTTVDLYALKSTAGSVRTSGSNQLRYRVTTGMIIPRTLTVEQGKPAVLALDVVAIYDGTNVAVIVATGVAMPTLGVVDPTFTLGPAKFNGTAYDGLQKWTLNFGIKEELIFDAGGVYPTRVHIAEVMPSFDLEVKNGSAIADYLLAGTVQSSTDSVFYLQKVLSGSGPVAAATAEHISITVDDGIIVPGSTGGANKSSHTSKLTFHPNYDNTNAILVKDTAVAIS